jgi:hypothetical protein
MRKTAFAVAALAAALSLSATTDRAAAMPSAMPTQLGLANADSGLVQKAAVVCGRWGCRRVVRGARVWVGPRRPLIAGPRWGWSSPGWGWSSGPSFGWGWGGPGWGRPGWGRPGWGW